MNQMPPKKRQKKKGTKRKAKKAPSKTRTPAPKKRKQQATPTSAETGGTWGEGLGRLLDSKKVALGLGVGGYLLFVCRWLIFIAHFGAVAPDAGWYMGVARNLADRGEFASCVNTVTEPGQGVFPTIHGRFGVQDDSGRMHFPSLTVGAAYFFPQALILKMFGKGFWSLRAWPILGFLVALALLFTLVHQLGGALGLLLFQVWLWWQPQIWVNFTYEALSEQIALSFLLLGMAVFLKAREKGKALLFFGAGLLLGCAQQTKLITVIHMIPLGLFLLWDGWRAPSRRRQLLLLGGVLIFGAVLPFLFYEGYRYFSVHARWGMVAYQALNEDVRLHLLSAGSGRWVSNFRFFGAKLAVFQEVGLWAWPLGWLLFLGSFQTRGWLRQDRRPLFLLLALSTAGLLAWYLLLGNGMARHAWMALLMAMSVISAFLARALRTTTKEPLFWGALACVGILFGSVLFSERAHGEFFLEEEAIESWRRHRFDRGLEGLPATQIFSLRDQNGAVAFVQSRSEMDRFFYVPPHLLSELSGLSGRVFFPLQRHQKMPSNPAGKDYVLFGPLRLSVWTQDPIPQIQNLVKSLCSHPVFQNNSYLACRLN